MSKLEIYIRKNGMLWVSPKVSNEWSVKMPTVDHRLARSGTVGLDISQMYTLKRRKGMIYIDIDKWSYLQIELDLLMKSAPTQKDHSGVKNALTIFEIKKLMVEHNLPLTKIPTEDEFKAPSLSDEAKEIKEKFLVRRG